MSRPYFRFYVEEMEQEFLEHKGNLTVVRALRAELNFRHTRRAERLRLVLDAYLRKLGPAVRLPAPTPSIKPRPAPLPPERTLRPPVPYPPSRVLPATQEQPKNWHWVWGTAAAAAVIIFVLGFGVGSKSAGSKNPNQQSRGFAAQAR